MGARPASDQTGPLGDPPATRAIFSCDGTDAHPRNYSIGFTDYNLHISSSVRYLGTAQGMSSINCNIEFFGCLRHGIKTCKALELATRQRIVWVTVLHRVCLENTLFLPSFPIPDMSDLELERTTMAPRRWFKLCKTFKQPEDSKYYIKFGEMLHPRTTRIIKINVDSLLSCQVGDTW